MFIYFFALMMGVVNSSPHAVPSTVFTSIKQEKFYSGSGDYISGSVDYVEITFYDKCDVILLRNKDRNFENRFINVVQVAKEAKWRAYSKTAEQSYEISIVRKKDGECIILDNKTIATYLYVHKKEFILK